MVTVNGGRISQVLWGESIIEWLCWNDPRQRRTDFLSIVGFSTLLRVVDIGTVNVGRISQVLWGVPLFDVPRNSMDSRQRRTDFSGIVGRKHGVYPPDIPSPST